MIERVKEKGEAPRWNLWEKEIGKYKAVKDAPQSTVRHWRRFLMFTFMQELNRNVLHEPFALLIERIIEGIMFGCGFQRIRVYLVDKKDNNVLRPYKTSKGHEPINGNFRMKIDGKGDAIKTLSTGEPLSTDNSDEIYLEYKKTLTIEGPYIAIPLITEAKPFGLICADTAALSISDEKKKKNIKYIEFSEHFETFARAIIAAIENWHVFDQRNQKIRQFELVQEFNELIEIETDKDKLLNAFVMHCVEAVRADGGHLKLYNRKTKKLELVAASGADVAPLAVKSKPNGVGFSNLVFKTEKAILVNDLTGNELMQKHKEFCKNLDFNEYLKRLENRKSALIVPLIKQKTGEIYGVLDLHGKQKKQFTELDKENLLALASNVTYAVDKTQQLERQNTLLKRQREILETRSKLLTMLRNAVEESSSLSSVLKIIRDSCYNLKIVKDVENVCLSIKASHTSQLMPPSIRCYNREKDCDLCLKNKLIIKEALERRIMRKGKYDAAFPINLKDETIGILYIQWGRNGNITSHEVKLLEIITKTAAILISTAKSFEEKIKQSATLYDVGQLSTKTRDFKEWFTPVMEKAMDIIGRENRNFHLVMAENKNGKDMLVVKESSDLYTKNKAIPLRKELMGIEIPKEKNKSLSGLVIEEKLSKIIHDIEKNEELEEGHPEKLPFHREDMSHIDPDTIVMAEVAIPLRIKVPEKIALGKNEIQETSDQEKVIGVLVIDSIMKNSFREIDLKFIETIANYIATTIHNQELYEERAKYLEDKSPVDRAAELSILLNSFLHDIKDPLQEIISTINLIKYDDDKAAWALYIETLEKLSSELYTTYEEFVSNFAKDISERKMVAVKEIINDSLATIAITRGLTMRIEGNYNRLDFAIDCYPIYIELAFRSIINNAVKYSKTLEKQDKYLCIDAHTNKENDAVTISFESSTTQPIPEDKLTEIFGAFTRFTRQESGKGLGLALAALGVRLHRGEIKAENIKEKNAVRIIVTLPKK